MKSNVRNEQVFYSLGEPISFHMKMESIVWLHYMLLYINMQIQINVEALTGHGGIAETIL